MKDFIKAGNHIVSTKRIRNIVKDNNKIIVYMVDSSTEYFIHPENKEKLDDVFNSIWDNLKEQE